MSQRATVTLPSDIVAANLIQLDNGRLAAIVTGHTGTDKVKLVGSNGFTFELAYNDHVNVNTPQGATLTFRADLVLEVPDRTDTKTAPVAPVAKKSVAPTGSNSGCNHTLSNPMK